MSNQSSACRTAHQVQLHCYFNGTKQKSILITDCIELKMIQLSGCPSCRDVQHVILQDIAVLGARRKHGSSINQNVRVLNECHPSFQKIVFCFTLGLYLDIRQAQLVLMYHAMLVTIVNIFVLFIMTVRNACLF